MTSVTSPLTPPTGSSRHAQAPVPAPRAPRGSKGRASAHATKTAAASKSAPAPEWSALPESALATEADVVLDAPPSTHDRLLTALLGSRALGLGSTARDRFWGWVGPILVTLLAAVLRLAHLGRPGTLVFDETYYVKQAYTLLMAGFDAEWPDEPNPEFETGNKDSYLDTPSYVVHPPVGKWMMAFGMRLGGPDNPASWRMATAIVGVIAVFLIARAARHLFSSTLAGVVAGGLFAVDGAAIVHSRTGLLDSFVMFWAVVAFVLLLADRQQGRRRLAARAAALLDAGKSLGRFGPSMGVRWYRLAAAVALGLCVGTKWSGMYFLAVFAVICVLWDASARRRIGITGWPLGSLVKDAVPAAATMLPIAAGAYLASWTGWFVNAKSYKRTWAAEHPGEGVQWLPEALRSLWEYHLQMWTFHNQLTAPHTYQAHPLGWLVQWRPTSFYYKSQAFGEEIPVGGVCQWEKCSQVVTSMGNPLLWVLAALALLVTVWMMFVRHDWRAVAVLSGLFAGWAPWLVYAHRTIFTFYSIAFAPFMYLALTYMFVLVWEGTEHNRRRRRIAGWVIGSLLALIVLVSIFFYPIWTATNVPTDFWRAHMWLRNWS